MLMLLIIFLVLAVVSIVLSFKFYDDWDMDGPFILSLSGSVIGVIGFIVIAIVWPSLYNGYKADVNRYHAIQVTIEESRKNASDIERATLTSQIIEINSNLATAKYWGDTVFGDQYPKEYLELEYLK